MNIFQNVKITLPVLRVEVPIGNMTLGSERGGVLELNRPDCVIRPWKRGPVGGVSAHKLNIGISGSIPEAADPVRPAVPARVHAAVGIGIAIGLIPEDIAGVIQNDVENDAYSVFMGFLHQRPEVIGCAKSWVDLQIILNAVA